MITSVSRTWKKCLTFGAMLAGSALLTVPLSAEPLKIGYSDWPGWVAWEVGIKKDWFAEEGVEVSFEWYDYVASMDAYAAGQLDAVGMTNGDALVTGATGKPSVGILINDYSNGNDMIVAKPGIDNKQNSLRVSYDYVHYGFEINLWKAQIILDAWIRGLPENIA